MSEGIDLRRLERRLLEEREQTLESVQQAEEEGAEGQRESSGSLARIPTHLADAASDTQEAEQDRASLARGSAQLREIDDALLRLREDPDGYTTCERCGRTIEGERLELVPWTRLCARCAREVEAESAPPAAS